MIKLPFYQDVEAYPLKLDGLDGYLGFKNGALATTIANQTVIAVDKSKIAQALGFISKLENRIPLVELDPLSFSKLNSRYAELYNVAAVEEITTEADDFIEEDAKLAEFLQNSTDLLSSEESAPVIKLVNSLFYQAIKKNASDIHIEVHENIGEVRFRVDGTLSKHIELDKNVVSLVISRIKIISNLDISERRIPQDGRTRVKIAGRNLDIRVSILPTYHGERAVMRILAHSSEIPTLKELGFNEHISAELESLLRHAHGMILVTGPTGSGKSTTLHASLQQIASPQKNVITIEDPVEYNAGNINQIQVNSKVGLTFASALRSVLRQDPDIIMVGEIRDKETAQISIQAALTGHLLLSTLHTNNATAAITRLADMGIESFLISSTLLGVLAQRLVRKLCPHCKESDTLPTLFAKEFELPDNAPIFKASGCKECSFTGYHGRVAVGEILILDDELKELISKTTNDHTIREVAIKKGMITLPSELKRVLLSGDTSLEEVIRVGIKEY
jgi:general secretion pathway protein E